MAYSLKGKKPLLAERKGIKFQNKGYDNPSGLKNPDGVIKGENRFQMKSIRVFEIFLLGQSD